MSIPRIYCDALLMPPLELNDWFAPVYNSSYFSYDKTYDHYFLCQRYPKWCHMCLHLDCRFSYLHCKEEADKSEHPSK